MNRIMQFASVKQNSVAPRLSWALRMVLTTLVLVVLSLPWGVPRIVHAGGNFVVNTSLEIVEMNDVLSLREAIMVANGTLTGPFSSGEAAQLGGCIFESGYIIGGCGGFIFDNITFAPSITEIFLSWGLPQLTDAGTWINGNANVPLINAKFLFDSHTFIIAGNDITISNLTITNGANGYADILVASGKDARIAFNYLGSVPYSDSCVWNGFNRRSSFGVSIAPNGSGSPGANNGVAYIYGNRIGCHNQYGVFVNGADYVYIGVQADGSTLTKNYIGEWGRDNTLDGVYLQGNGTDGVLWCYVKGNDIGYNHKNGIRLKGTGYNSPGTTSLNWIQGNDIFKNDKSGILLEAGAYNNFIGGVNLNDPNTIHLNLEDGISILNSNNNLIQQNNIYENNRTGVYLTYSDANTITDSLISQNMWAGVWAHYSHNNTIKSNLIGTNKDGTTPNANGHDGIALTNYSHDNTIGGTTLADRNIISGNTLCGIQ